VPFVKLSQKMADTDDVFGRVTNQSIKQVRQKRDVNPMDFKVGETPAV